MDVAYSCDVVYILNRIYAMRKIQASMHNRFFKHSET